MSTQAIHSEALSNATPPSRKRILVPIQSKQECDLIIAVLCRAAGGDVCEYRAMTVLEDPFGSQHIYSASDALCWIREYEQREDEARHYLTEFCEALMGIFAHGQTSWVLRQGNRRDAIVNEANSWSAAMILMVDDSHRRWLPLLSRSLSEQVLRKSKQTVQIVKPELHTVALGTPVFAP